MTFYVENETQMKLQFLTQEWLRELIEYVLHQENCFYDIQINILLTDNHEIALLNQSFRGIEAPTDVLSFPNIEFEEPADFTVVEGKEIDYSDPDSGELILGDIIISLDKVSEQAKEYGHSEKREFAFLIVHSILHLCGYDHMTEEEERIMFKKQEDVLQHFMLLR